MPTHLICVNAQNLMADPDIEGQDAPQGQYVDRQQAHNLSSAHGADAAQRPTAILRRGINVQGSRRQRSCGRRAEPIGIDGRGASAERAGALRRPRPPSRQAGKTTRRTQESCGRSRGPAGARDGIHSLAAGGGPKMTARGRHPESRGVSPALICEGSLSHVISMISGDGAE